MVTATVGEVGAGRKWPFAACGVSPAAAPSAIATRWLRLPSCVAGDTGGARGFGEAVVANAEVDGGPKLIAAAKEVVVAYGIAAAAGAASRTQGEAVRQG